MGRYLKTAVKLDEETKLKFCKICGKEVFIVTKERETAIFYFLSVIKIINIFIFVEFVQLITF